MNANQTTTIDTSLTYAKYYVPRTLESAHHPSGVSLVATHRTIYTASGHETEYSWRPINTETGKPWDGPLPDYGWQVDPWGGM